jgi:hypothetical protein
MLHAAVLAGPLAALLLAAIAPPRATPSVNGATGDAAGFAPGQVWTYRTRPGEAASRAVVCQVDRETSVGAIVHLQVEGVAIRNPEAGGGVSTVAGHLPLTAAALRESVLELAGGSGACAGFEEALAAWSAAVAAGRAGAFHVGVAEALDAVQRAVDASAARTVARPEHGPLAMRR